MHSCHHRATRGTRSSRQAPESRLGRQRVVADRSRFYPQSPRYPENAVEVGASVDLAFRRTVNELNQVQLALQHLELSGNGSWTSPLNALGLQASENLGLRALAVD